MLNQAFAWAKYVAKVIWGVALPVLQMALVDIIDGLQGSFVDSPVATLIVSGLGIFFATNGPKPVTG